MILLAIPKILAFVLILIIGWFVASLLAKAVAAVLRKVRFDEFAQRSGFTGFVHNMGMQTDAAGFIAAVTKWFVRLIALVVAFDALGLPAVSEVLEELLLWLPNLVVALVVLVIGGLAANALGNLVRGATAEADLGNPDVLARIAKVAVWGFAIIVAVNQLGIATTLVNTLFMGLVFALALAAGLAFGLGGRDTAAQIVSGWHDKARESGDKVADAARSAEQRAASSSSASSRPPRDGAEIIVEREEP
jgi:small-conductance mechanosensitive channel